MQLRALDIQNVTITQAYAEELRNLQTHLLVNTTFMSTISEVVTWQTQDTLQLSSLGKCLLFWRRRHVCFVSCGRLQTTAATDSHTVVQCKASVRPSGLLSPGLTAGIQAYRVLKRTMNTAVNTKLRQTLHLTRQSHTCYLCTVSLLDSVYT